MDVSRDEYPHQSSRVLPVPGTPSRGAKRAHHARAFARIFSHPPTDSWSATCDILSPPTRRGKLAPIGTTDRAEPRPFALTNRLTDLSSPPMNETGWRLRLHRQDRDRPHRARQAPHPDPGCQPQGAHPPPRLRTKRRTEKPRLPALSNRLRPSVEAFERAIARARRAALREAHARRESTRVVFSCPRLSVTLAPAAPAAAGGATRRSPPPRKDGGGAFPRRESGVFARATWRSRGRYLVGDLSGAKRSPKKVFSRVCRSFG